MYLCRLSLPIERDKGHIVIGRHQPHALGLHHRDVLSNRYHLLTLQVNGGSELATSVHGIRAELLLNAKDLVELGETF